MDRFRSRAKALRASQTSAEAKLWLALRGRRLAGWKFRRQHPIGRFVVDFATIEGKLVVEVDGDTHAADAAVDRDARRTTEIERAGFLVMRVTNADVYEHLDGVLEAIDLALGGRYARPADDALASQSHRFSV